MSQKTQQEIIEIGPECFGYADGSVLSWRGENYTPQKPTIRVRLHNAYVRWSNRRNGEGDS